MECSGKYISVEIEVFYFDYYSLQDKQPVLEIKLSYLFYQLWMEHGRRGHLGRRAVLNVFSTEEEHALILHLENLMGDIVLDGICRAETVLMGTAKVCLQMPCYT